MCWNKEVSIFTYFVICLVSYKLWIRNIKNDRVLAFFIISYGSIQLFEAIIWLGIDINMKQLVVIGSTLACLLLYLHPLAIISGMYYDKAYEKYKNNIYYKLLFIISIMVAIFGLYNIITHMNKKNKIYNFISYPDRINKHLVWDFPSHYPLILVVALLISIFVFKENKIIWLSTILYYFLPAIYVVLTNTISKKNLTKNYNGSYWCWYVAIFSFLLYFLNPKIQKL